MNRRSLEFGLGLWGMQAFKYRPRHNAKLYQEMVEDIQWAEELGFDTIWLTEHRVWFDGYVPSLLEAAGAMAAVSRRIRIGTSALLAPQHDPLRIAEAAALVDVISGGRLELGMVVAYRDVEFDTFGIPRRERGARMEEILDILHLAWTEERFSYRGRFYQYENVRVTPKPIQRPIPIWIGGWAKPVLRRAGRRGLNLIGARAEDWPIYEEAAHQAGVDISRVKMTTGGDVWVDEDGERAKAFLTPLARYLYYEQVGGWGFFENPVTKKQVFFDMPHILEALVYQTLQTAIFGNPETVVAKLIERIERLPPKVTPHVFMRVRFDSVNRRFLYRCMELLATEVLPRVKEGVRRE